MMRKGAGAGTELEPTGREKTCKTEAWCWRGLDRAGIMPARTGRDKPGPTQTIVTHFLQDSVDFSSRVPDVAYEHQGIRSSQRQAASVTFSPVSDRHQALRTSSPSGARARSTARPLPASPRISAGCPPAVRATCAPGLSANWCIRTVAASAGSLSPASEPTPLRNCGPAAGFRSYGFSVAGRIGASPRPFLTGSRNLFTALCSLLESATSSRISKGG